MDHLLKPIAYKPTTCPFCGQSYNFYHQPDRYFHTNMQCLKPKVRKE